VNVKKPYTKPHHCYISELQLKKKSRISSEGKKKKKQPTTTTTILLQNLTNNCELE